MCQILKICSDPYGDTTKHKNPGLDESYDTLDSKNAPVVEKLLKFLYNCLLVVSHITSKYKTAYPALGNPGGHNYYFKIKELSDPIKHRLQNKNWSCRKKNNS